MGKMIITQRWVTERRLELTDEDWVLRNERDKRRRAKPLPYMLAFTRHLEPCPFCGNAPKINSLWNDKSGFFSIKLNCYHGSIIDCGDWYRQLSRAGLDWNYRVRYHRGEPLKIAPHFYKGERRYDQ